MENKALGVRKGTWTKEEDFLLKKCIEKYGEGKWHQVPLRAGLNRCRKSCRLRWLNYLRPNIKRGCFTKDEVDLIIRLHKLLGNKWSLIAGRLPGRTANDVKNFWNTHIEKKLVAIGQRRKENVQKSITITNTKIIKPRPRTFSKLYITCPNETTNAHNLPNSCVENPKNKQQPSSNATFTCTTSSSKEEADECIRWWNDLLEATEINGELGASTLIWENHKTLSSGPRDVDNYITQSDHQFGSLLDDANVWETVNLDG
ncbi:hypothetical protein RD792_001213 [Penstemon davidsonii]|uniref:Uncharacterized protein n=1 Tax=Penstemon davidsonii TaxID=160366 RepID=A0ABR0DMS9_9LAMI|nr:hypothetical protein RD792_001213 [Penstemon davidsonii]